MVDDERPIPNEPPEHRRASNVRAVDPRLPPHDTDAEESLVGAALLTTTAIDAATTAGVGPSDFYKPSHGLIFHAALALHSSGVAVDAVTVSDELRRQGTLDKIGGPAALLSLQARTPSTSSAGHYAGIVRRCSRARGVISLADRLRDVAYAGDLESAHPLLSDAREQLAGVGGRPGFTTYSPAELLDMPRTFEWLVRGMFTRPTYGMTAGEMKTLKSYVSMFTQIAVASGTPVFGHFAVDQARPTVTYVGEGGRVPFTNRLERIARAMEVDLRELPMRISFDVAPFASARFRDSLERDLAEVEPGLVTIDPYYAFHGSGPTASNAANLFEEGGQLTDVSSRCTEAGACLDVVNHFNQTGAGAGLKRITMAAGGEWVDSWRLLSHRSTPDVANGKFQLLLVIGSRQWGGTSWDLDLDVGPFDAELGEFVGEISWELSRHVDGEGDDRVAQVRKVVEASPGELTREEVARLIGGNVKSARHEVDRAAAMGLIETDTATRIRADGKPHKVVVFVVGAGRQLNETNQPTSEPGRYETEAPLWEDF